MSETTREQEQGVLNKTKKNQPQEPEPSRDATVRPTRPRVTDRAVTEAAAIEMLPDIEAWNGAPFDEAEADTIRKLLRGMVYSDGYEMAREFERAGFDANSELVDVLENWDGCLRTAHAKAVGEWITAYGVRPRFAVGDKVVPPRTREHVGEVVRVDERRGEYTVRVAALGHVESGKGMGTIGHVYLWEDVENITPAEPADAVR